MGRSLLRLSVALVLLLALAVLPALPAAAQTVVYRVNAGGPALSGTPGWSADQPSPYVTSGSNTASTASTISMAHASIPAGTPMALFQTERWDPPGGNPMQWSFPVTPGSYEVRLYFAETYPGVFFTGGRVFDVAIEGQTVLDNYDVFAEVGGNAGVVKSFTTTADSALSIAFAPVTENPMVKGIEIISLGGGTGSLQGPTSVSFGSVTVGQTASQAVALANTGSASLVIESTALGGSHAGDFADDFNDAGSVTLAPGQSISLAVSFTPSTTGTRTATLSVNHSASAAPLQITLGGSGGSGTGTGTVLYRVNAGGPQVTGAPNWTTDTAYASSGSATASTAATIDMSGVPAGLPMALFQTERWDPAGDPALTYAFPVEAGTKTVRLYFAETYTPLFYAGGRVFDVQIEGQTVLSSFDVFAQAGGGNKALVREFTVSSDATLTIAFQHKVENPMVKAIEILGSGGTAPVATLAPSSTQLGFGTVSVGSNGAQTLSLTNTGSASLTVSGTSLGGTDAGQFSDNFTDAQPVTLAPGQSTSVTVQFNPTSAGDKTAGLAISHSGSNSPVQVALAGTGQSSSSGSLSVVYRLNSGGAQLTASPNWSADDAYVSAGTSTVGTTATIAMSHPSIPAGTPMALFQTERWDPATAPEMGYALPVQPGTYVVRLYFAETYTGTFAPGARVFDVAIEGQPVLDNYDVYAEVGGNAGVVKEFTVTSDSTLNIAFGHVTENPMVKGIEVLSTGQVAGVLQPSALSLSFGSVAVGSSGSASVTVTNMAASGGPSVTIDSTTITGTNAADFADSFNDAGNLTLGPGQAATVTVTFAPQAGGTRSASLAFNHDGANNPLAVSLSGSGISSGGGGGPQPIGFGKSTLVNASSNKPTSLEWGPDQRLYVSQQDGVIKAYTVTRNGANSYAVAGTETITLVQQIPNHNDNGSLASSVTTRLITGILVRGTASNPVIYVTSSDPRIGAGSSNWDTGLDTNSGVISKLTWTGNAWTRQDLVRGLPRSEENHAANGMALDVATNTLFVTQGGNTNMGAPSNNFALLPEYALSAAILKVDLTAIGSGTYDLPTLDDPARAGSPDSNDPFGGNDGANQALVTSSGPVTVYAPGFRNPYDILLTSKGLLYTVDNGANAGWGGTPINCSNQQSEPGISTADSLHLINQGYYGGHPNPFRASKSNTVNGVSPVQVAADSQQCTHQQKGMVTYNGSTNGLTEYTTGNFGGAMQGDLLSASHWNAIYRTKLNSTGVGITLNETLFSNVGAVPLDVTAVPASGKFPGTIWVADYGTSSLYVFEPSDYSGGGTSCSGTNSWTLDEDKDGYANADEIAAGTNPCSAADVPADFDGDKVSNKSDTDDDNDGQSDSSDPFALDATNGKGTNLPVVYSWDNDTPSYGGILTTGFTGLMTNKTADYETLFDPNTMTIRGAAGVVTVDQVYWGDAYINLNANKDAFQFGVNVTQSTPPFLVHTRLMAPFAGITPEHWQSFGMFIGNGDQDNYIKFVAYDNNGQGGLQLSTEFNGSFTHLHYDNTVAMPGPDHIDLYFDIDPAKLTLQGWYTVTTKGQTSARKTIGTPVAIPQAWFTNSTQGLAVGILSTTNGGPTFSATWDMIEVVPQSGSGGGGQASLLVTPSGGITASTYGAGSFQVGNTGAGNITSVSLDLAGAWLTDLAFDPNGTAGDTLGKGFTVDSGGAATGVGTAALTGVKGNGGSTTLSIPFSSFNPGESMSFSIDIDPVSIQGVAPPGPGEAGSVSGLELAGASVTVSFADGTQATSQPFAISGSLSGAQAVIRAGLPAKPLLSMPDLTTLPATVSGAKHKVRVTAPAGSVVRLTRAEGAWFGSGTPPAHSANSLVAKQDHQATVGSKGIVDFNITLTKSVAQGGINILQAATVAADGSTGQVSAPVVLTYAP